MTRVRFPIDEHHPVLAEEAAFLNDPTLVFNQRHYRALGEIQQRIGLEYFGIDCAIARDGRLLLFEADAAMLVHGTDPPDLYPYKRAGFDRIQTALMELLASRR